MVASDTVVGLVGAGILLVALVGVFVYESRQGGESSSLDVAQYNVNSSGTATTRAGTGMQLAGGQCLPAAGQTSCTPASTQVDLTVKGLPGANGAAYVVFLKGSDTVAVGPLEKSGNDYKISKSVPGNQRTTLLVTLEPKGDASSPSGPTILTYSGLSGTGKDLKMAMMMPIVNATGTQKVSYSAGASGTNATATLTGLPSFSGLSYRGWMLTESSSGESWTFVGNFTSTSTGNGTISGIIPGKSGDYTHFVVTLEPTGSFSKEMPKGPEVMISPEK